MVTATSKTNSNEARRVYRRRKKKIQIKLATKPNRLLYDTILPVSSVTHYVRNYFNKNIQELKNLLKRYPDNEILRRAVSGKLQAYIDARVKIINEEHNQSLWKEKHATNKAAKKAYYKGLRNDINTVQLRTSLDPDWKDTVSPQLQNVSFREKIQVVINKSMYRLGSGCGLQLTMFLQGILQILMIQIFQKTLNKNITLMKVHHFQAAIMDMPTPLRSFLQSLPCINEVTTQSPKDILPNAWSERFINYINREFKQVKGMLAEGMADEKISTIMQGSSSKALKQLFANTICEIIDVVCLDVESFLYITRAKTVKNSFVTCVCNKILTKTELDSALFQEAYSIAKEKNTKKKVNQNEIEVQE